MPDNKKPLDKSKEGVAATLKDICEIKTDPSSLNISAGLIADNLAKGAKGIDAITESVRGMPKTVGQCVADHYDGKKPSLSERVSSYFNGVVAAVAETSSYIKTADLKADAKLVGGNLVMDGVSTVTHNTPETLKNRPAQLKAAENSL